jgi:transcriptional regulator of arginine metabolism
VRAERRRDLLRILRQGGARSQHEIVEALIAAGHHVTQATVSRDLREIGAVKVRDNGGFAYRLADQAPRSAAADLVARNLLRTLSEFALEVREAASLVVIVTAPGHAAAVARAIDLAGLNDVVGTIAGDDTIFVATSDPTTATALARTWRFSELLDSNGGIT